MQRLMRMQWMIAFTVVVGGLAGAGCGKTSQAEARQRVANAACDYYQRCGNVGAGQTYASRDDCMVTQQMTAQNALPPAACEGKINDDQLDRCIGAIEGFRCGDPLDFLDVLNECNSGRVCTGS